MAGLPKIALAWLKANPGAPKSASPPPGLEALQGAVHPDANLLAAFVEKTLTERERAQVLGHLSQCAECREVAAFTLPAEVAVAEPSRVAPGRRWNSWPVLRWGAMAAVLGALTVIVLLHPGTWNGHSDISKEAHPPVPVGNISSAPQTVSPLPPALPPTMTAQAKAQMEMQESAGELALTGKAPGPHRDTALNDRTRAQAKPQVTLMASSRPPATIRAEIVPGMNAERAERRAGNALSAEVPTEPSTPPAPAAVATAPTDKQATLRIESQASMEPLPTTTQSVEVTAGSGGGIAGGEAVSAPAAKAAPHVSAVGAVRMAAQAPIVETQATHKKLELGAGLPAALWSVAANGKVQRSTDGGKSFEQIHIAHGIKFRTIAALGNDVWTGGTGGALFHSVDGGATWTRAGVNFAGNAAAETITDIQLHDSQHITATTASGTQWASEDGGQHWQKHP